MTESEKMKLGLWYDANYDQELSEEREKAEDLYFTFNHTAPKEKALREDILKNLLPKMGERVTILSPFYTDYGYNCNIGSDCFINHNAYLMDCAPITLGSHCFIGPNCGMYTAVHATIAEERNLGLERRFRLLLAITSGWAVMSPFFQVSPLVEIPLSVPEASSQRIFLPMSLPPVIHAVFSVQLQRPTALQRNNRGSKK